jgi:hypothetical protein
VGPSETAGVVILTAIRLGFDAVLEVDVGAAAGSVWEIGAGPNERGRALHIAVAVSLAVLQVMKRGRPDRRQVGP